MGEQGPELVRLPYGSTVHPSGTSREMARAADTGGRTVILNVYAAPLSNPVDVGAAVVQVLKQYEMANGAGWRS